MSYLEHSSGDWANPLYYKRIKLPTGKYRYFYSEQEYRNYHNPDRPSANGNMYQLGGKAPKTVESNRTVKLSDFLFGGQAKKNYRAAKKQYNAIRKERDKYRKEVERQQKQIDKGDFNTLFGKSRIAVRDFARAQEMEADKALRGANTNLQSAMKEWQETTLTGMLSSKIQNGMKKVRELLGKVGGKAVSTLNPEIEIKRSDGTGPSSNNSKPQTVSGGSSKPASSISSSSSVSYDTLVKAASDRGFKVNKLMGANADLKGAQAILKEMENKPGVSKEQIEILQRNVRNLQQVYDKEVENLIKQIKSSD